jgi:hypothetical protein
MFITGVIVLCIAMFASSAFIKRTVQAFPAHGDSVFIKWMAIPVYHLLRLVSKPRAAARGKRRR